ncbi:MAG: hypothetical protein RLZZ127_2523 [Planctomycetota bacterium]|jgi:beta-aspartyl-peptidase (threonine type)
MSEPVLVIHGGSGPWAATLADPARKQAVLASLAAALAVGGARLADGADALEAVQAAIQVLEDDPTFNAGRGSALTDAGHPECDAALMDGRDQRAGAVAGLRRTRNPVTAARAVLDEGRHVLLAGPDAETWLHAHGVAACDPSWLVTPASRAWLDAWRAGREGPLGTVGAVALDRRGGLAAGTSTGGLTGKRPGRIGDSPLIGAGTWADGHAAVSCTGMGEAFIRAAFAVRAAAAVAAGDGPEAALGAGLDRVRGFGGTGGAISVAADGRWAMRSLDPGMARGVWTGEGVRTWVRNPAASP